MSVSETDFQSMVDNECSYLIRGAITKADGVSCLPNNSMVPDGSTADANGCYANTEVNFEICANAPVHYGPCELDGMEEIVVNEGGSSVAITMHGDHLFFNGFPEGNEGGVMRLAQWLADCDLNLDGTVTRAELESIELSALAEIDMRYELGGAPTLPNDRALTTAWDYVRAQLMTQGHIGGEGECAINGQAHDHGHEH